MSGAHRWDVSEKERQEYARLVQRIKPRPTLVRNVFWAFLIGGLICALGQLIQNSYRLLGLDAGSASAATSATLIFLGAFLTGIGVYDEISRLGGAGGIVPITGFANSMVSPAMEFKSEGFVFGVGSKLFSVAGPVLVWGIVTAWAVAVVYYFFSR